MRDGVEKEALLLHRTTEKIRFQGNEQTLLLLNREIYYPNMQTHTLQCRRPTNTQLIPISQVPFKRQVLSHFGIFIF